MALNIPMPGTMMDAFIKSRDQGVQNDLRRAQMEQARGAAQKSQMLANLLGGQFPGQPGAETAAGGGSQLEGGTQPSATGSGKPPMSLNQAMAAYLAMETPFPSAVDGVYHTAFGDFPAGETPAQKRIGTAQEQSAAAALKSTSESAIGGASVNPSIKALTDILDNPNYKNIAGTAEGKLINSQPLGIPLGSWLQKTFPNRFSKKDAELAGTAKTHMGTIITGVAAKFKGPFKQMVGDIINEMKPNLGDSVEMQRGKLRALQDLSDFADKVNESIAKDIGAGMDPTLAALKAAKEANADEKIRKIASSVNNPAMKDMIFIIDSTGKQHSIHESNLDEAKKIDPGLKVKK